LAGLWLFDAISILCTLSPPVPLCIAWVRFFAFDEIAGRPKWRRIVESTGLTSVSTLLIICMVKFIGYRCDAGAGDWSCVITWRSFAGTVVRLTPLFIVLAFLRAKRTRVLPCVSGLAVAFDWVLIDRMA
jgi:hypothetical protein